MLTHQQLKEYIMFDTKKAKDTINFNKFFPKNNAFVNVDGAFKDAADWWIDLTIQTGLKDATQFWVSDYKPQEAIKQLRAMIEAAEKSIEFAEKCMAATPAKESATKIVKKK
jgi:hypothetical protein